MPGHLETEGKCAFLCGFVWFWFIEVVEGGFGGGEDEREQDKGDQREKAAHSFSWWKKNVSRSFLEGEEERKGSTDQVER